MKEAKKQKLIIKELKSRAKAGNADAMASLAYKFFHGDGVSQDYEKAAHWAKLGAEAGSSAAQNTFGVFLAQGIGLERDLPAAKDWLIRSYEQGEFLAAQHLSYFYQDESVFGLDPAESYLWAQRAMELDEEAGAVWICDLLRTGFVPEKETNSVLAMLEKKAERGSADCQRSLGAYYCEHRQEYPLEKGIGLLKQACHLGNKDAAYNLGLLYMLGAGIPIDIEEAVGYFQIAAEDGNVEAIRMVISLKSTQPDLCLDSFNPLDSLKNIWRQGKSSETALGIAACYEEGISTEIDYSKAQKWYEKAAALNSEEAIQELGRMLLYKEVTEDSSRDILEKVREAADRGNEYCCQIMSHHCLKKGNYAQSYNWAKKGAELGDKGALALTLCHKLLGVGTECDPSATLKFGSLDMLSKSTVLIHLEKLLESEAISPANKNDRYALAQSAADEIVSSGFYSAGSVFQIGSLRSLLSILSCNKPNPIPTSLLNEIRSNVVTILSGNEAQSASRLFSSLGRK